MWCPVTKRVAAPATVAKCEGTSLSRRSLSRFQSCAYCGARLGSWLCYPFGIDDCAGGACTAMNHKILQFLGEPLRLGYGMVHLPMIAIDLKPTEMFFYGCGRGSRPTRFCAGVIAVSTCAFANTGQDEGVRRCQMNRRPLVMQ